MKDYSYLKKEYDFIIDERYLKTEDDIEAYFLDEGAELIDKYHHHEYCDELDVEAFVNGKAYAVNIKCESIGQWQDYGPKIYYPEEITAVTWKEIPIPEPVERFIHDIHLENVTAYQISQFDILVAQIKKENEQ